MVRLRKPDVNVVEDCGTNHLVSELGDYTSSIEYRSIFDQYIIPLYTFIYKGISYKQ